MTQHTPGPWQAETLPANAPKNERPWVGRLADSQYSALSCGETQEEAVANAKLIAAAPDLLDALKNVTSLLFNAPSTPFPETTANAIGAARKAIAKAEGR